MANRAIHATYQMLGQVVKRMGKGMVMVMVMVMVIALQRHAASCSAR